MGLLIGWLAATGRADQQYVRLFGAVGFLGGFTTFSTFAFETFTMIRDGEFQRAAINVGVQVFLGLALVWIGYALTTSK